MKIKQDIYIYTHTYIHTYRNTRITYVQIKQDIARRGDGDELEVSNIVELSSSLGMYEHMYVRMYARMYVCMYVYKW